MCQDGITFLQQFRKPIDLLYLDAWDPRVSGFQEKHLMAYLEARPNLHPRSLILIDDTDLGPWSKGTLVIQHALQDGYHIVYEGRQTLLAQQPSTRISSDKL